MNLNGTVRTHHVSLLLSVPLEQWEIEGNTGSYKGGPGWLLTQWQGTPDWDFPHLPFDNERRWALFVGFEKWRKALPRRTGVATLLPPIDVLMIGARELWYAEDGRRIAVLKALQSERVGGALAAALGGNLSARASEPSERRVKNWVNMTRTPFDPFEAAAQMTSREIACPKCRASLSTPYITESGTGYLQQRFAIRRPHEKCSFEITRDALALRKLATDLASEHRGGFGNYIAETLHTPRNVVDEGRGETVKTAMLGAASLKRPATLTVNYHERRDRTVKTATRILTADAEYADFLMQKGEYKLDKLGVLLCEKMKGKGGRRIRRIMSAYFDDKIFSVELIGAVLRQGSFVKKMYDFQWTQPGFFDSAEDEVALQHAIARYHAFLDLMSSSHTSFVLTLDIDLVWHTHQLMSFKYSKDTLKHVGRFVDHDDEVEESMLSSAFEITCRAWTDRYGVRYTHCGCPLPGATIGQRLARLVARGRARHAEKSYLVPSTGGGPSLRAAMHPSDHNAVFAFFDKAGREDARRRRRAKAAKRAQREAARGEARHDVPHARPNVLHARGGGVRGLRGERLRWRGPVRG
ncbi:hypothetical protein B0H17DRAFT_1174849, partial [Mycena rosella]